LVGYATVYNSAHHYKGRIEVFSPGAFCTSLRTKADLGFLGAHIWSRCYGSTGDGSLQLFEDDRGLAFTLGPTDDEDGRALLAEVRAGKLRMSVAYQRTAETVREIDGTPVAFIEAATLTEISAVAKPAVPETTVTTVRAATFDLKAACRSGDMKRHVAAANFEHAAAKLLAALS